MIKHDEVRQHLSMWSTSARPLMREYITQQEELTKAVKEYFTLLNSDAINQDIIDRTDLLEETIKEMVMIHD